MSPAPSPARVRRRRWLVLAVPVFLAAIAGLAWLQPTLWRTQPEDAVQGATDRSAVAPDAPVAPPAAGPPNPAAPPTSAAAPNRTFPALPSNPIPSAPAIAEVPPAVVAPSLPAPSVPPVVEAAPQSAAPGTTAASPPLAFPVVAIRMRAGSPAAQAEASRISALLKTSAARLDVQAVPTSLRTPTIRYFREADAASARALASALPRAGTPWRLQSRRAPRNPVPGRLEVWIAEP